MNPSNPNRRSRATGWMGASLLVLLLAASGCTAQRGRAFVSPEEGTNALVTALRSFDRTELRAILGPDGDEIISSGDEVADRNAVNDFLAAYDRRNEIIMEDETATLIVGEGEWPLPVMLVKDGDSWWFDVEDGKEEVLARRIGRNELSAIEVCRAIVDAQRDYAAMRAGNAGTEPEYAQKFRSDPGQRNGLYWDQQEGEPLSPLGPGVAEAVAEGYGRAPAGGDGPRPFHGYCFRMLTAQGNSAPGGARSYLVNGRMTGGFAVVAWPVEYEISGIMTFIVSNRGIVYQKDLGDSTGRRAAEMTAFDPDSGWEIVP